jgi:predicted phosphate transport protein (TIGR00153 family)
MKKQDIHSQGEEPAIMKRSIDFIFQALLPKDKTFYPLFDQACANMVRTADVLEQALKSGSVARMQSREEIERLEKQGDEITHAIIQESGNTFVVPFDREDIIALALAIDDVVDFIHGTSKRMDLYKVHDITPTMIRLSEIISEGAKEIQEAIHDMRSLKKVRSARAHLKRVDKLESEADRLMQDTMGQLFRTETDAAKLLKTKEVVSFLEEATNKCKDAATVLESVLIKFT